MDDDDVIHDNYKNCQCLCEGVKFYLVESINNNYILKNYISYFYTNINLFKILLLLLYQFKINTRLAILAITKLNLF